MINISNYLFYLGLPTPVLFITLSQEYLLTKLTKPESWDYQT